MKVLVLSKAELYNIKLGSAVEYLRQRECSINETKDAYQIALTDRVAKEIEPSQQLSGCIDVQLAVIRGLVLTVPSECLHEQ